VAKKGNIVSFEDARRTSSRRSKSGASPAARKQKTTRASKPAQSDEWAMYASRPAKKAGSGIARPAKKASGGSVARSSASRATASRSTRVDDRRRSSEASAKKSTRTRATAAETRERKKRQKAKERASKQFDRTYASRSGDARQTEGAPRAAVYKGEMGPSQRRSTRMQRASEAGSVAAKLNPAGWLSNINLSSRTAKLVTMAICAVFICVFLYTPAQQYYEASRENARLEAEYVAVSERNAALDAHNEALASDAGMEDAVRQKFGYVVAGEQTAVVSGLSDEVEVSKRASAEVEGNILASSIKAPEEWYTPFLDAFFGVQ